jgi:predicted kinase
MQKVYVPIGIIGSGKSTWARTKVQELAAEGIDAVIVSKDPIRTMLRGEYAYDPQLESMVKRITVAAIDLALENGVDVIVDETHLTKAKREDLVTHIRNQYDGSRVRIVFVEFDSNIACIERRVQSDPRGISPEHWRRVGLDMLASLEPVAGNEPYNELIHVPFEG